MESADDEDIDGAEGDIVDVPTGGAVHSQSFRVTMSGDEEEVDSAAPAPATAAPAPAAAAEPESGGDGAGPPAAGGAVDA